MRTALAVLSGLCGGAILVLIWGNHAYRKYTRAMGQVASLPPPPMPTEEALDVPLPPVPVPPQSDQPYVMMDEESKTARRETIHAVVHGFDGVQANPAGVSHIAVTIQSLATLLEEAESAENEVARLHRVLKDTEILVGLDQEGEGR